MAGFAHRSSPLLSPGRHLLLLPSLAYAYTSEPITGDAESADPEQPEGAVALRSPSGHLSTEDILALPFGAAAYLDTRAIVSVTPVRAAAQGGGRGTSPDTDAAGSSAAADLTDATLLLDGEPLGPVRLWSGTEAPGADEKTSAAKNTSADDGGAPAWQPGPPSTARNTAPDVVLLLETKRLLPWYDGLPYSLRDPRGREYRIVGCRPVSRRPWRGRVTEEELDNPPETGRVVNVDGVLFPAPDFERLAGKALKAARREGGIPRGKVYKALDSLHNPIRGPFIQLLVETGRLRDLGELLVVNPPEDALSPMSRGVLQELRAAGSSGVPLSDRPKAFRDAALLLENLDLSVVLPGRMAWATGGFGDLRETLRSRFSPDITADNTAEFLGASKSLAKDLLRRLADDGAVESLSATEARWSAEGAS